MKHLKKKTCFRKLDSIIYLYPNKFNSLQDLYNYIFLTNRIFCCFFIYFIHEQ